MERPAGGEAQGGDGKTVDAEQARRRGKEVFDRIRHEREEKKRNREGRGERGGSGDAVANATRMLDRELEARGDGVVIQEEAPAGISLRDADVRPTMMIYTPRAPLFPEKQDAIVENIKNEYLQTALFKMRRFEEYHIRSCRKIRLVDVQQTDPESNSYPSRAWFNLFNPGAMVLGQERWTVDSCGSRREYRVQFCKVDEDDAYFVNCKPLTFPYNLIDGLRTMFRSFVPRS